MRLHSKLAAALSVMLLAGLVVAPASPVSAAAAVDGEVTVEYIIPTRHGKLFMEAVHPTKAGKIVKSPTILTYTPYSALGRNGSASRWVPRGYTRATVDVIGTGNSGGCYDYGGKREKDTAYDIVEWIARQKWSTKKVAMIGGSYDGTTAIAAAVMRPPHLTTIVPEAAISRWYEYAYSGGIRYAINNEKLGRQGPGNGAVIDEQGFDTPIAFDFGFAAPPPLDPQNPDYAERVQSSVTPCDELNHVQNGYEETPDYNAFWLERDYVKDAHKINIPVLVSHNWGDWNVKQEQAINLFRALKNAPVKQLSMGTRWDNHGTPGGAYQKTVDNWMDRWLLGKRNGVEKLPMVTSQTSDSTGPGKFITSKKWPKTKPLTLIAQGAVSSKPGEHPWKLLPYKPDLKIFGPLGPTRAKFAMTNANTESHALHHAPSNHDWFWFESPILKKDVRIFGEIKVQIYSTVQRKWITFTPSIADYDPSKHQQVAGTGQHYTTDTNGMVAMTRGWLDSRYRKTLRKQSMVTPNKSFGMTVVTKPQDYIFKKGHLIGLNIQTEINEWSLPKIYPGCDNPGAACADVQIDWTKAQTRLIIPVAGGYRHVADLFSGVSHHH